MCPHLQQPCQISLQVWTVDALTEIYRATWVCYHAQCGMCWESLFDKSIGRAFLLVDCFSIVRLYLVLMNKFQSPIWASFGPIVSREKYGVPYHFLYNCRSWCRMIALLFLIFHFNLGVDALAKIYCSPYWTLTHKASHKILPFNNIKCIAMSTSLVQIKCMRPFSLQFLRWKCTKHLSTPIFAAGIYI